MIQFLSEKSDACAYLAIPLDALLGCIILLPGFNQIACSKSQN